LFNCRWQQIYDTLKDRICLELLSQGMTSNCRYSKNKFRCCAVGASIHQIPANFTQQLQVLFLLNTSIEAITVESLKPFRSLQEIIISHSNHLTIVEGSAFEQLPNLLRVSITYCRKLEEITGVLLKKNFRMKSLIVSHNSLKRLPGLEMSEHHPHVLDMIDFSHNHIEYLGDGHLKLIKSRVVRLNNNELKETGAQVFAHCHIRELHMNNNIELKRMSKKVFDKLEGLRLLNLSSTSITELPINGLRNLTTLSIKNTVKIKQLPPILTFTRLTRADFTYPHHCCLFKYAKNMIENEKVTFLNNYKEIQNRVCNKDLKKASHKKTKRSVERKERIVNMLEIALNWDLFDELETEEVEEDDKCSDTAVQNFYHNITCNPMPDILNPCEDIVGYPFLRIIIWIVWILAIIGNIGVWIVLLSVKNKRMRIHYLFIMTLSFADLLTGCYLAILAIKDSLTANEYYNHAVDWQTGYGCTIAGFLSVFASEISIISMFLIAFEIYYNTRNAIYGKQMKSRFAYGLITFAIVFAFTMASFPLMGISSYQRTSICLPLAIENYWDQGYIIFGLFFNLTAFLGMLFCYILIIRLIKTSSTPSRREDRQMLIRTGLLIGADMLCWMPTLFFGITSALNFPLISLTSAKHILFFCHPLNSCLNPFLYVFMSKVVQKGVKNKTQPILSRLSLANERNSTSNSLSRFYNSQPPDAFGSSASLRSPISVALLGPPLTPLSDVFEIESACDDNYAPVCIRTNNLAPRKSSRVSFQDEVIFKAAETAKFVNGRKLSVVPRSRISVKPDMADISENSNSMNSEDTDKGKYEKENEKTSSRLKNFSFKNMWPNNFRAAPILSLSRKDSGRGDSFSSTVSEFLKSHFYPIC
uniref:G_PROTEIN_RECEP_F1_2 domain-containing protein n=1 Tax=Rhabditophanes sp. KR3021 TaxID=114890 RepID=A0AC35TSW6_9BILA